MRATEQGLAMALATTIGLTACGGAEPARTSPAPTTSRRHEVVPAPTRATKPGAAPPLGGKAEPDMPPPGSSLDRVMRAHFKDALLIRQAVVAGAPDQAVYSAKILALVMNLDDLPPGWREHVERMQQAARRITDGTSIARAASAVADIGVACGQCHQQLGGPAVANDLRPPQGATLRQGMERHAWATERLWEGIVVPSSEAWNAGVDALSAPFPADVARRGAAARTAAADFESIIEQAPTKNAVEERAALYAQLLVTCAACHRAGKR